MQEKLPLIYLIRHGETEWSKSGQHTGLTDKELTAVGEDQARALAARLRGANIQTVLSSPLARARKTCELAGLGDSMRIVDYLHEWNYGDYEGLTSRAIREKRPDWQTFRDGFPGGESLEQVSARGKKTAQYLAGLSGVVAVFSHGHFLRFIAAAWLEIPPAQAGIFTLGTTSVSVLGFDHESRDEPCIRLWNDTHHLDARP